MCVLPNPRIPVTARTTDTPGPPTPSASSNTAPQLEGGRRLRHLPCHHLLSRRRGGRGRGQRLDVPLNVLILLGGVTGELNTGTAGYLYPGHGFASSIAAAAHLRPGLPYQAGHDPTVLVCV